MKKIKPNPKLDALVAKHVMKEPGTVTPNPNQFSQTETPVTYRPYSSDLIAAWSVIEKLNAQSIYLEELRQSGATGFYCEFLQMRKGSPVTRIDGADASSAPEAICKAALFAVGISVEDIKNTSD